MTMFTLAVWALCSGLTWGWNGFNYRIFFLFGGVLNIPFLALGSVFLSVSRRAGHVMTVALFGFSAIATTLVSVTPFARTLPEGGIPADIFPSIAAAGFGPRLLAAIAGGMGTLVLVTAALWGAVRFRKSNRRRAVGNLVITAGVLAAATGGTILGFLHESSAFSVSLLVTASLIWWGYRLARSHTIPGPG
jgi:spore maturation protein SpmB